jgi:glucosyl-3-phosphoglycerate synthase
MTESAAERWTHSRTFHHSRFPPERVAAERTDTVTVCLPARECAATIGPIVASLIGLREAGVIDEVVVVDAASRDGTAEIAAGAGASVLQEAELLPDAGPVRGKGDAMWRALSELRGDVVCFLDADLEGFEAHFASGVIGPIVCEPRVAFSKAFYRRPFTHGGLSVPEGGGRVNHLAARPALALFYPELAGVRQPLAGEVAARRELLQRLPFTTGYGVEIAMLIDVWEAVGLEEMAQVDLDEHRNAHQPLSALAGMSYSVLEVVARRLERDGRLRDLRPSPLLGPDGPQSVPILERPPLAEWPAVARRGG